MVGKAALTVTADNKSKVYGAVLPALTLSYSGFVNGDTTAVLTQAPALSTTAVKSSAVGDYPITLTGGVAANYQIVPVNGTLSVTPAALTITAADKSNVYGTALLPLTATYSGFVNGDSKAALDTPVVLDTPATAGSPVGTCPIVARGATDANYSITFVPATLMITADDKTRQVGQPNPVLTASYNGFVNGDSEANLDNPVALSTPAKTTSPPGSYAIKASAAKGANYTITFVNGTLTVTP